MVLAVRDSLLFTARNTTRLGAQQQLAQGQTALLDITRREAELGDHALHHDRAQRELLNQRLDRLCLTPNTFAFVVDADGDLIAVLAGKAGVVFGDASTDDAHGLGRSLMEAVCADLRASLPTMQAGQSGAVQIELGGTPMLLAYAPLREADWSLGIVAPVTELTAPATTLAQAIEGEIFRAIRNGIDAEGRWLFIMASVKGRSLSDEDIEALIAYLRNTPAMTHNTPNPPDQVSPLGLVMLGAGMLPDPPPVIEGIITAPPKGPTAEYGEYIFSYQDCTLCHGEDLRDGAGGQLSPMGPSLHLVKGWTEAEFITTLRTGVDPSGHQLNGTLMPWPAIGRMDDDELQAMYHYLQNLPAIEAR